MVITGLSLDMWVTEQISLGEWFKTVIHTGMKPNDSTDSFKKWFSHKWHRCEWKLVSATE